MSQDPHTITDRRRLRRKLTFWRLAALVVLVAAVAIFAYTQRAGPTGPGAGDHIARVEISGVITADEDLIERLERIRDADNVKALILAIESPGGTTYGGERLYKTVRSIAEVKPVAAEVRGLAASAGYMVASAADHIVAGETSIVGSIGVIIQYGNVSELLDNLGISVDAVKSAPLKAEPSPFSPPNPQADEMLQALVGDTFDWFVDLVAERRGMSREETLALADGSIFSGRQGLANGLVDAIGAEPEVRAYLAERDIADGLRVIEWEDQSDGSLIFGAATARWIASALGAADLFDQTFEGLTRQNLFLDGLVSVWQFGGWQARDDRGARP